MSAPFIILMIGRTASGKTTISKMLSESLDAFHLKVAQYKRVVKPDYCAKDSLSESIRDKGYLLAIHSAKDLIDSNNSLVIDSSFSLKSRRKLIWDNLLPVTESMVVINFLDIGSEATQRRLQEREGREHEDIQFHASSFKVYEHINGHFEQFSPQEVGTQKSVNVIDVNTYRKTLMIRKRNDHICDLVITRIKSHFENEITI
jgi:predicted kinase